jgi:hypothetical protein
MKLTNNLGLPEPLVNAVANDGYDRGDADISVTSLLSPPRQSALKTAFYEQIEEDASDRIWSLLGQAIHTILERAATVGVAERRLSIVVEGWKVSGGMDLYHSNGVLEDYKVTTVWKFKNNEVPNEFVQQLNCYAEILRQNGERVTKLRVVGILRDWSKMEAVRDPGYPQAQVITRDVPLWPMEQAQAFLKERVLAHRAARFELPECTSEERWQRPDIFAVMRAGGKRSLKNYTSAADASAHVASQGGLYVQTRPGASIRCSQYCSVNKFCSQYQKTLEQEASEPVATVG